MSDKLPEVSKDTITKALFMGSREILGKNNVDDDFWAKRLKKLAKAKKINCTVPKGEVEYVYSDPLDDNDVQLKAVIQIGNHLGHVVAERREISGGLSLGYDERLNRLIARISGKDASSDDK